jgi:hypothetical protein
MHKVLTLIAACTIGVVVAQPVQISNLMVANPASQTLFTGIENHLLLSPTGLISSVKTSSGAARLSNDTVYIDLSITGTITLSLVRAEGQDDYTYHAKLLPEMKFGLEGHPQGIILLQRFQQGQKFIIQPDEDGYWAGRRIDRFMAVVNNATVMNEGNATSQQLATAIRGSQRGRVLQITLIEMYNERTGRHESIKTTLRIPVQ